MKRFLLSKGFLKIKFLHKIQDEDRVNDMKYLRKKKFENKLIKIEAAAKGSASWKILTL
jgi:hypothetical protein